MYTRHRSNGRAEEEPVVPAIKGDCRGDSFLQSPGGYTQNTTVAFPAQYNGADVIYEISTEASQASVRSHRLIVAFFCASQNGGNNRLK